LFSHVFSYGFISGSTSGGSGGGHGGSGGRGAGMYSVGQGYDSLYTPVGYGNPGGYGRYKGNVAWEYTENNYKNFINQYLLSPIQG
jgi:hypothetical protein